MPVRKRGRNKDKHGKNSLLRTFHFQCDKVTCHKCKIAVQAAYQEIRKQLGISKHSETSQTELFIDSVVDGQVAVSTALAL